MWDRTTSERARRAEYGCSAMMFEWNSRFPKMFRPPAAQARANTFAEESTPLPWGPPIIHERSFTFLTELIGPTLRHARRQGPSWNFTNSGGRNRGDPLARRAGRTPTLSNLSSRFHLRGLDRIVYGAGGDGVSSFRDLPRGSVSCCLKPYMTL